MQAEQLRIVPTNLLRENFRAQPNHIKDTLRATFPDSNPCAPQNGNLCARDGHTNFMCPHQRTWRHTILPKGTKSEVSAGGGGVQKKKFSGKRFRSLPFGIGAEVGEGIKRILADRSGPRGGQSGRA